MALASNLVFVLLLDLHWTASEFADTGHVGRAVAHRCAVLVQLSVIF